MKRHTHTMAIEDQPEMIYPLEQLMEWQAQPRASWNYCSVEMARNLMHDLVLAHEKLAEVWEQGFRASGIAGATNPYRDGQFRYFTP